MKSRKFTVIDFFCGAGGFSEGFRQQGFQIIKGIDNWQPAIDTHNLNHGLNDSVKDVLDFWGKDSSDTVDIDSLPDSEIIVGSPSCVSFSMSNRAGKADKTLGIRLIESYLRVVAVKRNQKNSRLFAWFMENVPQSKDHIKSAYSFADLNLSGWARRQGLSSTSVALYIHGDILNAGDYGAPQDRKRYIVSEWVSGGTFIKPEVTHLHHIKSKEIRSKMPKPNMPFRHANWSDPNYPSLTVKTRELTDHFYDTGLYEIEWEKAQHLKTNHPFMGRMSFPENEDRTCRTVIATKSGITREAIIYKSEYNRKGNGEYRLPTIREIASLMGFPYTYQFVGNETTKWRQVGNSVCPPMSAALAAALRRKMGLPIISKARIDFSEVKENYDKVSNLNTFAEKSFNSPRGRMRDARFRRHPIKEGNMTVDLMNYDPSKKGRAHKPDSWKVGVFFGTGNGHGFQLLNKSHLRFIEMTLRENGINTAHVDHFMPRIKSAAELQYIYETDLELKNKKNPLQIVKALGRVIENRPTDQIIDTHSWLKKDKVPATQLLVMYGLLRLLPSQK